MHASGGMALVYFESVWLYKKRTSKNKHARKGNTLFYTHFPLLFSIFCFLFLPICHIITDTLAACIACLQRLFIVFIFRDGVFVILLSYCQSFLSLYSCCLLYCI